MSNKHFRPTGARHVVDGARFCRGRSPVNSFGIEMREGWVTIRGLLRQLTQPRLSTTLEFLMYRMVKTLPWLATACLLAATVACNSAPSAPSRPDGAGVATSEAGPSGETLKVTAPTLVSPTGSNRLENRKPTMTVRNVTGKYAGATFSYEFQLLNDSGAVIQSISLPQGAGTDELGVPG